MGYLQTWLDWSTIDISKYALENSTYSTFYYYWRDELFGRVMRLFEENTDPVPISIIPSFPEKCKPLKAQNIGEN